MTIQKIPKKNAISLLKDVAKGVKTGELKNPSMFDQGEKDKILAALARIDQTQMPSGFDELLQAVSGKAVYVRETTGFPF